MTDEEIDAMEAGREMDALVAEKVMGLKYGAPFTIDDAIADFHPSGNIADAWQVVEKMAASDILFSLHRMGSEWQAHECVAGQWYAHFDNRLPPNQSCVGEADTAPLAICRAALKCCRNVADKNEDSEEVLTALGRIMLHKRT